MWFKLKSLVFSKNVYLVFFWWSWDFIVLRWWGCCLWRGSILLVFFWRWWTNSIMIIVSFTGLWGFLLPLIILNVIVFHIRFSLRLNRGRFTVWLERAVFAILRRFALLIVVYVAFALWWLPIRFTMWPVTILYWLAMRVICLPWRLAVYILSV